MHDTKQNQPTFLHELQNMDSPPFPVQEMDSDVNEDSRRERLLDESIQAFLDSVTDEM